MVLEALEYNKYSISEEVDKYVLTPKTENNHIVYFFDVLTSHSVQISDNITDNWLENSTVVNDCIGLAPLTVTLSGMSGEKVFKDEFSDYPFYTGQDKLGLKFRNKYIPTDKLRALTALYPPIDSVTQSVKNVVNTLTDNAKRYAQIYDDLFGVNAQNNISETTKEQRQTRLQAIYEELSGLRFLRTAFIVETPYSTFEDMYIQSISFTQENVNHITDISVTLKQLNFSEVKTTAPDAKVLAVYNDNAKSQNKANEENLGKVQGDGASLFGKMGYQITGLHVGTKY